MHIRKTVRRDGVNAAIAVNVGETDPLTSAVTSSQNVEIIQRNGRTTIIDHDENEGATDG